MKKIFGLVFSVCLVIASSVIFNACDKNEVNFDFKTEAVDLYIGQNYDPFTFIETEIDDNIKQNITFKVQNNKVAYVNNDKVLVVVDNAPIFSTTVLTAYYNNYEITDCVLKVTKEPIQLEAPKNIKYDKINHCLTWNRVTTTDFFDDTKTDTISTYEVKYTRVINNTIETITQKVEDNKLNLTNIGEYSVQVRTIFDNPLIYTDSDFTKNTEGEYTYCAFSLMAKPININFVINDDKTSTLTWDANNNPSDTNYKIYYTRANETEEIIKTSNTLSCTFSASESLKVGQNTIKIEALTKGNTVNDCSSISDVVVLTKLATPIFDTNSIGDGLLSWNPITYATSYNIKISDLTPENLEATSTSKLYNVDAGQHTVKLFAQSTQKNVFNSETATLTYTKLPTANLNYNSQTGVFTILNNESTFNNKITLTSETAKTNINSGNVWTPTNTNSYGVTSQLLAKNNTNDLQVNGNIATGFKKDNSETILTNIQKLNKPTLRYVEDGNKNAIISFFTSEEDCVYSLIKDLAVLTPDTTKENGTVKYNLGNIATVFNNIESNVYKYQVLSTKQSTTDTLFIDTISDFLTVQKIVAPQKISISSANDVTTADGYVVGATTLPKIIISEIINNEIITTEKKKLNLEADSWEINVINLPVLPNLTKNIYYTQSNASIFKLQRLNRVENLKYNYEETKIEFDAVDNANNYKVFKNNALLNTITTNTLEITDKGNYSVSVQAFPMLFNYIEAYQDDSDIKYLESKKVSCNVYQSNNITNLHLTKNNQNEIVVNWAMPENSESFPTGLKYNIYLDNVLKTSTPLENVLAYTFEDETFATVKEYVITVEVISGTEPKSFYAPNNTTSVSVTRLAPVPTLQIDKENNLLFVNTVNQNNQNIYFADLTKVENAEIDGQNGYSVSIDLDDGESHTYTVKLIGKFGNGIYYLDSQTSSFTLTRLNAITDLTYNINNTKCTFNWTSPEIDANNVGVVNNTDKEIPDYVSFSVGKVGGSLSGEANNSHILDISNSQSFTFQVKQIATFDNTKVDAGITTYLNCNQAVEVFIPKENDITIVNIEETETSVKVTWRYEKVENITYEPTLKFVLLKPNLLLQEGLTNIVPAIENAEENTFSYTLENKSTVFDMAGNYVLGLSTTSSKTLPSSEVKTYIEKYISLEYYSIDNNVAIFTDVDGNRINVLGNPVYLFENLPDNVWNSTTKQFDLSNLTSGQTYSFSVKLQAVDGAVNNKYYLDGEKTNFKIKKFETPVLYISDNKIIWDENTNENLKHFNLVVTQNGISQNIIIDKTATFLSLDDDKIKTIISTPGEYQIKLQLVAKENIYGVYNLSTDAVVGFVTSDFSDNKTIEKLNTTQNIRVTTTSNNEFNQDLVTISWDEVENAEYYKVYIYDNNNVLLSTTQVAGLTKDFTTDFETAGTYNIFVQAFANNKISGNVSTQEVKIVRLSAIDNISINQNQLVQWAMTSQNNTNGYVVEVLSSSDVVQGNFLAVNTNSVDLLNIADENIKTFIENLNYGNFKIKVYVKGTGLSNEQSFYTTLTSNAQTFEAFKFKTPDISVIDNKIHIESTDETTTQNAKFLVTITDSANTIFEIEYVQDFDLPLNIVGSSFKIKAFATVKNPLIIKKYINSNMSDEVTKTRLNSPTNLNAIATGLTSTKEQTDVKFSWTIQDNATYYEIYVNNVNILSTNNINSAVSGSTQYIIERFLSTNFANAGTYDIQVVAKTQNEYFCSLKSEVLQIVRLNSESGSIAQNKTLNISTNSNGNLEREVLLDLYDKNNALLKSSGNLPSTTGAYNGFNTELDNYIGGKFITNIYIIGNGASNEGILTLTSQPSQIVGYKLFAPTITMHPSEMALSVSEEDNLYLNNLSTIFIDNYYSVEYNSSNIINGINYANVQYLTEFVYPLDFEAGNYTFTAQSKPNVDNKNMLPSNITAEVVVTRLDTPSNLKFTRSTVTDNSLFTKDSAEASFDYLNDNIVFSFDAVANVDLTNSYYFENATKTMLTQQVSHDINSILDFIYAKIGSSTLKVTALAEEGSNYINSKPASLEFTTLPQITNFKTNNGIVSWNTNSNSNGYLVKTTSEDVTYKFWQTLINSKYNSILEGIIPTDGIINYNIKALGNVSIEGTTSNIILDSMYLTNSSTFNKLEKVENIGIESGYLKFNKITSPTTTEASYYAYIYDQDGVLLNNIDNPVILNNLFTQLHPETNTDTYFIAQSSVIDNLTPNTLYKIKIQSQINSDKIIYSDLSDFVNIKVLENKNISSDINMEIVGNDLTNKVITAKIDKNAKGILRLNSENLINIVNIIASLDFENYKKISIEEDDVQYTLASLGSSSLEEGDFYYLSSAYTQSREFLKLETPTVQIQNGVLTWTSIPEATGYYLFINNIKIGDIYGSTSYVVPDSYANNESAIISAKVYAVENGTNAFASEKAESGIENSYIYIENLQEKTTNVKEIVDIKKLHKPVDFNVVDGAMCWTNGISNLNAFNSSNLNTLLNNFTSNQTFENIDAIQNYISSLLNSPFELYSKYSGIQNAKIDLIFINSTNERFVATGLDAYKFLKISNQQKNNITTIIDLINNYCNNFNLTTIQNAVKNSGTVYETQIAYSLGWLKVLQDNVNSLSALLGLSNTGLPNMNMQLEDSGLTLNAGTYTLQLMQNGNNQDFLNSSVSNGQTINISPAPTNLEISDNNDGNYLLKWDKVNVLASYNAKLNNVVQSNAVYILYGETASGTRSEIIRTLGEATGTENRLKISLTDLINDNILTTNIVKLYLVVAGDNNNVVLGLKSQQLKIRVLPKLTPYMEDGVLYFATSEQDITINSNYELKINNAGVTTTKIYNQTEFYGDLELVSNNTYTLTMRARGYIANSQDELSKTYILSGRTFTITATKLPEPLVDVNKYGIFNWQEIDNASNYAVYIQDTREDDVNMYYNFVNEDTYYYYESSNNGYNNYKFRALGSNGTITENASYHIISKINNEANGLMGVKLSNVLNVQVENGLIVWDCLNQTEPTQNITTIPENMAKVIGYRLNIYKNTLLIKTIYTTQDTNYVSFDNEKAYLDFKDIAPAGSYTITIQAYIYCYKDNIINVGQNINENSYAQLLGEPSSLDFNKVAPPTNLKIINGQLVWLGENNDSYYIEVMTQDEITKELTTILPIPTQFITTPNNYWWTDHQNIITSTVGDIHNYIVKVKAYKQGYIFSDYAFYTDIEEEYIKMTKLPFALSASDVTIETKNNGNYITFEMGDLGFDYGFNIRYKTSPETEYSYVDVTDLNYNSIVEISDGVVSININAIRNNISSMNYGIQLVPLNESTTLKSNYCNDINYKPPVAIETLHFDAIHNEYYWEYNQTDIGNGYIVKDELLDSENNIIATYFYKTEATSLEDTNFCVTRTINEESKQVIVFKPSIFGYIHRVSVAVSPDPKTAWISPYITSEELCDLATNNLFEVEKYLFAENSSIYTTINNSEALTIIKDMEQGSSLNPYLINSSTAFENMNMLLSKNSYQKDYTIEYFVGNVKMEVNVEGQDSTYKFKQTTDLILENFLPIGINLYNNEVVYVGFANTYDGNKKSITYTLTARDDINRLGLFAQINEAGEVKNLIVNATIDFCAIDDYNPIVGVITSLLSQGKISYVNIERISLLNFIQEDGVFGVNSLVFGGVAGENRNGIIDNAVISESSTALNIKNKNDGRTIYVGGIVGKNSSGIIQNCGNNLDIELQGNQSLFLAGIAGFNNSTIRFCYNKGDLTLFAPSANFVSYVGGIVGNMSTSGTISYCYAYGSIIAQDTNDKVCAGGIVGLSETDAINKCFSGVSQIILTRNSLTNEILKFGGTLFGKINSINPNSDNTNYYINEKPITLPVQENYGNFAIKVDITQENYLNTLVNQLSNEYFKIKNIAIVLQWEENFINHFVP